MDCVVKSWIFGTITNETCALLLEAKFRNFIQGDLSVAEYCKEMKRMADMLEDLGETVTDRTLVQNVIRGLN